MNDISERRGLVGMPSGEVSKKESGVTIATVIPPLQLGHSRVVGTGANMTISFRPVAFGARSYNSLGAISLNGGQRKGRYTRYAGLED